MIRAPEARHAAPRTPIVALTANVLKHLTDEDLAATRSPGLAPFPRPDGRMIAELDTRARRMVETEGKALKTYEGDAR